MSGLASCVFVKQEEFVNTSKIISGIVLTALVVGCQSLPFRPSDVIQEQQITKLDVINTPLEIYPESFVGSAAVAGQTISAPVGIIAAMAADKNRLNQYKRLGGLRTGKAAIQFNEEIEQKIDIILNEFLEVEFKSIVIPETNLRASDLSTLTDPFLAVSQYVLMTDSSRTPSFESTVKLLTFSANEYDSGSNSIKPTAVQNKSTDYLTAISSASLRYEPITTLPLIERETSDEEQQNVAEKQVTDERSSGDYIPLIGYREYIAVWEKNDQLLFKAELDNMQIVYEKFLQHVLQSNNSDVGPETKFRLKSEQLVRNGEIIYEDHSNHCLLIRDGNDYFYISTERLKNLEIRGALCDKCN